MATPPTVTAQLTEGQTETRAEPAQAQRRREQILPPWAVILWNDEVNEMGYVVRSILRCVPKLSQDEAIAIMMIAHLHGRARVTVCPLELAELYRDRLKSRGLTATVEPA